ncbi:hypothetical protein QTN46_05390 [Bacillus amyloliquefaciens]|jgi:hypothetical protein|nr:hypothetical protein [Bacillus amyloliquefaciens]AEB23189.1 hypothetical protein BAMTA208_05040 [Bacillus amyloliquefaciens TA208]AEB62703.1 hypothetical protein LL3_01161 [Bacillus amyloliquefaciens LL3]AEK88198.1 hypothetical protein BAXH7_01056 [Bacillus amyloliquefaciens XH7]KYC92770.1 hypothetical protein B425_1103 [Bacillus amyloliquefaciens]WJM63060.1 hypothetical protein QTN46_05390 [Bacillus amyloliquefaciens]
MTEKVTIFDTLLRIFSACSKEDFPPGERIHKGMPDLKMMGD